jgi:cytoplasmic iron level regulating protein YaaA (DUF328/UPF0246 family)
MLFLLSPAKSLDYAPLTQEVPHTLPQFVPQSKALIEVLRQKSPQQIAELMPVIKLGAPNSPRKTRSKPCSLSMAMFTKG